MSQLRKTLERLGAPFAQDGKLERLGPLWRAFDSFVYSIDHGVRSAPFVRDLLDIKRVMIFVVVALIPTALMAVYNTGYQACLAIEAGAPRSDDLRIVLIEWLGVGFSSESFLDCSLYGLAFIIPIAAVTFAVGGFWEGVFDAVRRHEVSESFLVTAALFTLIVPPTTPLWQVALGISFGVVMGKMIFGGTGYNVFNPALTGRAFLFFAYPAQHSGDEVWVAVDAVTTATPLSRAAENTVNVVNDGALFWDAFVGLIPGSMGETSALACLLGALFLVITGVASYRTILAVVAGTISMSLLLNALAPNESSMMAMPFYWHMVLGSWAFGTTFMATEPVTSPHTNRGKIVYGFLIGLLIVLVRVLNPSFPEGVMLSILLMNIFASLIDHYATRGVVNRRRARDAG